MFKYNYTKRCLHYYYELALFHCQISSYSFYRHSLLLARASLGTQGSRVIRAAVFPCQLRLFRDLFELVWSSCLLYPSHLTRTIVLLVVCRHKLLTLHLFLARTLNTDKSPVQPCHHPLLQVPRDLFKVSISPHDQYIAIFLHPFFLFVVHIRCSGFFVHQIQHRFILPLYPSPLIPVP